MRTGSTESGDADESAGDGGAELHTIEGEFSISGDTDSVFFGSLRGRVGETCEGDGGYSDITAGVGVSVRNRQGETVGSSTLEEGSVTDATAGFVDCTLPFEIEVPRSDLYLIEVADRGELGYTHEDMQEMGWKVELGL